MPLTELQLPTKDRFYSELRNQATQMDNLMKQWDNLREFVAKMDSGDLDAMGVAAGQVRTDLQDFQQAIADMLNVWNGNATTPTSAPSAVIDNIRSMS